MLLTDPATVLALLVRRGSLVEQLRWKCESSVRNGRPNERLGMRSYHSENLASTCIAGAPGPFFPMMQAVLVQPSRAPHQLPGNSASLGLAGSAPAGAQLNQIANRPTLGVVRKGWANERGASFGEPYLRGLPSLANEIPAASAAMRRSPALFKASVFSGPLGIDRAAAKASSASASNSCLERPFPVSPSRPVPGRWVVSSRRRCIAGLVAGLSDANRFLTCRHAPFNSRVNTTRRTTRLSALTDAAKHSAARSGV
jgi:hypothetical protein